MLQRSKLIYSFIISIIFLQILYYVIITKKDETQKPFRNASYFSHLNYSIPNYEIYRLLPNCSFLSETGIMNTSSNHTITFRRILYEYHILEDRHGSSIQPGGHWFPSTCQKDQRIAVIICYRDREQHFKMLLDHLHPFLQRQQLDYTIFVINQHGQQPFNRGALFNAGFLEARKLHPFTCFIFHDVDLIPEDIRNVYKCADQPRHMAVAIDKFDYKLAYSSFFGGVTSFKTDDFLGANGYSNIFWGWGGEDDDMYSRVIRHLRKRITRYSTEIARYKMIRSNNHISAPANPHRFEILRSKYDFTLDGVNTAQYKLLGIIFYKLFTLVNVTFNEETYEQICSRLRMKTCKG